MASKASGRSKRRRDEGPDVKLSKFLSYICRHGAKKEGISLLPGGYVAVSAILSPKGKSYSEEDVRRVVANCPKSRFALSEHSDGLLIRANQGHSIQVDDLELTPVLSADDAPVVVHGTNKRAWEEHIQSEGLSRMKRTHIHFATGLPGDSGVISGMRTSSQVLIFVDIQKAIDDGLKFYRSSNDVILCPGDVRGILSPSYFKEIRHC